MRLLYFLIISTVLFALNVACGADFTIPASAVSSQETQAQEDDDWPENPSAPMTCLRIAYDHYLELGNTPRNAWNNAVTACGRGMDSTCPETILKHYRAIGQDPRTAWNNAIRDCRALMPRILY